MRAAAGSLAAAARAGTAERRRFALAVAAGAGTVLASGGLLVTSGYLISRAAQRPPILELTVAIVAVRAFAIARAALRYGERLSSHDAALRMLGRIRSRFYRRLAPLVPGDIGGPRGGDLLSRFVGDVDALQDLYLRALAPPLIAALVIGAASLTAWAILPAVAPVVLLALLVSAVAVPALAGLLAGAAGRRQAPARAQLTAELVETLDGVAELVVAGRAGDRAAAVARADRCLAALARRDALAGGAATALGSLLLGLSVVAVLLVAIPAVHAGRLPGVLLAGLAFLMLAAFEAIAPLPLAARRLGACAAAWRRLDELCEREPSVRDPDDPAPLPAAGDLVADGVVAGHGSGPVLDGVTLRLSPGRIVGLVGPSGAGKTTLAQLLVRFRDPEAGAVSLGGVDLRRLTQDDVRGAVVLAAQDAHVFNTTLRANLALARSEATDEDLWAALDAVGLEDWVRTLPDGLASLVGNDGAMVSGGQRQRLGMARALLADARFLILDEPTAHLDEDAARELLAGLAAVLGDRGALVITHGPCAPEVFDEVLELRAGRIAPAPRSTLAA